MRVKLVEKTDAVVKFEVDGKLTFEDFRGDNNPLDDLAGDSWASRRVLINLSKITFMDSTAVGWLLNCNKRCKDGKGKLILHSTPPFVAQVFNMLRMGKTLALVADEPAALALPIEEAKH